jgi:Type II secretion system (T2SS), protein E, N-terminal domain
MPSLSSSIVNQQVASVRDVEEALSRQSLYGGDLITNLLELAAVSEERLSKVLAESHDLEPAPVGELPVAPDYVRRLVPGDVAQRFALYPLAERDGTLTVAVAEPLPTETEQDLSFSLGATLVQKVALLVRVRQAIARDYGTPLDRRSLRVLARLSGKPDPSPSSLPLRTEATAAVAHQPLTASPEPSVSTTLQAAAPKAESSVLPQVSQVPRAPAMPDFRSLVQPAPQGRPRRLGPFTAAMAEHALHEAESRDDVLRAFFDFASQYFEYAALFAVHGDLAEGKDASGAGAPRARIVAVGVPLDLPSAMSRARDSATYELTRLGRGGLDGALAKDLERRPGRLALFLPVQVRARTVFILYGDHGDRDVELSEIGDVIAFAPLVASAFERMILRRRMRERGVELAPPPAPQSVRFSRQRVPAQPIPNAVERAATLASLIDDGFDGGAAARKSLLPRPRPASPPPISGTAPTSAAPRSAAPRSSVPPAPPSSRSVPPPSSDHPDSAPTVVQRAVSLSWPPLDPITPPTPRVHTPAKPTVVQRMISIGPLAQLGGLDEPPSSSGPRSERGSEAPEEGWDVAPGPGAFPRIERGTKPGVGSALGERIDGSDELPASQRSGSLPRLQLVADTHTADSSSDGPEIDVSESSAEDFDEDEYTSSAEDSGVPLAPASRALAYSARPLPPRAASQDMQLPSVIVDVASDTN